MTTMNPFNIPDDIYKFLDAYADWAYGPNKGNHKFHPSYGLCHNAVEFDVPEAYWRIQNIFKDQGMCEFFPFGEERYNYYKRYGTQPEDPARREWVMQMLASRKLMELES